MSGLEPTMKDDARCDGTPRVEPIESSTVVAVWGCPVISVVTEIWHSHHMHGCYDQVETMVFDSRPGRVMQQKIHNTFGRTDHAKRYHGRLVRALQHKYRALRDGEI